MMRVLSKGGLMPWKEVLMRVLSKRGLNGAGTSKGGPLVPGISKGGVMYQLKGV